MENSLCPAQKDDTVLIFCSFCSFSISSRGTPFQRPKNFCVIIRVMKPAECSDLGNGQLRIGKKVQTPFNPIFFQIGNMKLPEKTMLEQVYGESERSGRRFEKLAGNFKEHFGYEPCHFFSSPGRSEIIGNHTDHNGGKIIAASVSMDTIGAAAANGMDEVRVISEGYDEIRIDLRALKKSAEDTGTAALLAGLLEGADRKGFRTGGFDAYISTEVIPAAGVSSSASFEMLICAVINGLFNQETMECTDYAVIGQYAENVYRTEIRETGAVQMG